MELNAVMKILRLNSISGPIGGLEDYIENVNGLLKNAGHEIFTITLTTVGTSSKSDQHVLIKLDGSPIVRMLNDSVQNDDLLRILDSYYDNFKPDLIHLHHYRIAFATVSRFLMSKKVPVVFTAHDALAVCPLSTLVKPGNIICEGGVAVRCGFTGCKIHAHLPYEIALSKSFKKLAKEKIKAFICPSYSIQNYLVSNNFSPAVHLPSFSYFDPEVINKEPDYDRILSQRNIGFIGRLEWYKGIDDLIRGFKIFLNKYPGYNLIIAGAGPYEKNLRNLTLELGIKERVNWIGKINKVQREDFFKQIVCNVVPSKYWENFALSAQESLLRSVPTIGTRIGGIPEIVQDGVTGYLVKIASPSEIADKLAQIVENKDSSTRLIMKNGREFVMHNLNPEKHIQGLLDIYGKVVSGIELENGYDANFTSVEN